LSIILVLIDGVGIATDSSLWNPFNHIRTPIFSKIVANGPTELPHNGISVPTRTDLGVDGLPQSATGQTTILTGINAAQKLGRHLSGFPTKTLRAIIEEENILKEAYTRGLRGAYINAYQTIYLHRLKRLPKSAPTLCALSVGQALFSLEMVKNKDSLYQDFTNLHLIEKGYDLPLFSPRDAGATLAMVSKRYHLTIYEYFLTDLIGHSRDLKGAILEIFKLDSFLEGLIANIDLGATSVIVTSDHGNMEDLDVKTHTKNPVATLLWGRGAEKLAQEIFSLEDIFPSIKTLLPIPCTQ
jgi:hypothetical protein